MTRLAPLALTAALLLGGCAATFTLRNDRPAPVRDVEVKAAGQGYTVPELAAGAQDVHKLKVKAGGDLNVNYTDEGGHRMYTSSREPLKPGDSRKWLLKLTPKTLLETEILK